MTIPDPANSPVPQETQMPGRIGGKRLLLLVLLAALLGGGGYIGYDAYRFMKSPASTEPKEITIDIRPGVTFDRVAWDLHKAGALSSVFRFRILAKLQKKLGAIQAGEFTVNTGWTPEQLLSHLTVGKPNLYRLALREGLPWWEVARLVEEGGFATAADFETVIHDPAFLRRYGIPFANAEGFLYPETYLLKKPKELGGLAQAETVARMLVEMFWKRSWKALERYAASGEGIPGEPVSLPGYTLHNGLPVRTAVADQTPLQVPVSAEILRSLVILASLVEKETGVSVERPRVAGVYANRLRRKMLLQCDPTILYGLGKKQSGPIRLSQLEDPKNRYNTYIHPGLPPGPICSPGAASIQAAMAPEQHTYLYFVATGKPDGTHTFSTNLRDHQHAVRAYRKTQGR